MGDQKQMINHRQLAYLAGILLIGGNLITVAHEDINIGHVDAWFSEILPGIYAVFIAYFFCRLNERYPGKNLFEIVKECFGSKAGSAVNAVLLLYIWLIVMRDIRSLADIVKISMLPVTPEPIIMLLFVLVLFYYVKEGIEVVARINDLLYPVFIIFCLLLPFLLANEFQFMYMRPILTAPLVNFYKASFVNTGWYGDIVILGAFLHTITVSRQIHAALRCGIAWALVILTMLLMLDIAVLGVNIAQFSLFPQYTLVQQMHLTDFLDRLEIVVISLWMPIFVIRIAIITSAFMIGLASFAGKRNIHVLDKMSLIFLLLTTLNGFGTIYELFDFGNLCSAPITFCVQIPLFAALWLSLRRKKNSGRKAPKQQFQPVKPESKNRLAAKFSYKAWMAAGNLLLLLAVLFVHIGAWAGPYFPAIGNTAAILYGASLLFFVFTSSMELSKSGNVKHQSSATPAEPTPTGTA